MDRAGPSTHRGEPRLHVVRPDDAPEVTSAPASAAGQEPFDLHAAYADHGGSLLGFAVNTLGDRQLAEDCVQEVFVRAWRHRDRYGSERGSLRTWLFAIARNVVIDAHRARTRRPAVPTDPLPDGGALDAGGAVDVRADPKDDMSASLDRLVVHEALSRITSEHRDVIVAVHLRGAGYSEVSEATGVPVATLRTRMYYGLRALRGVLAEMGEQHV